MSELINRITNVIAIEYDYARNVSHGTLPQYVEVLKDARDALEEAERDGR